MIPTVEHHAAPFPAVAHKGIASWYGAAYRGKPMANGKPFNPDAMTCAANEFPLGTRLHVAYRGRSVVVIVTDRGPAVRLGRIVDLSRAAFTQLAPPMRGIISVQVTVLP